MQAALTAAQSGHQVSLYESSDKLGGHLIEASSHPFKHGIGRFSQWLQLQLQEIGAEVVLNKRLTAEEIIAMSVNKIICCADSVTDAVSVRRSACAFSHICCISQLRASFFVARIFINYRQPFAYSLDGIQRQRSGKIMCKK